MKIANTVLSCKKGNIFGLREFIFTMDVPVDSALSGIALGQLNFQNLFQEAFVCNYIVTEDLMERGPYRMDWERWTVLPFIYWYIFHFHIFSPHQQNYTPHCPKNILNLSINIGWSGCTGLCARRMCTKNQAYSVESAPSVMGRVFMRRFCNSCLSAAADSLRAMSRPISPDPGTHVVLVHQIRFAAKLGRELTNIIEWTIVFKKNKLGNL